MEIDAKLAQECVENFADIMQNGNLETIRTAYSSSVSFATPELAEWLNNGGYLSGTNHIEISFGIYTESVADQLNIPELAGRITAFIWPKKPGEIYNPYNVGNLLP
jgi:hypothetical protein